jgi:hypothetical protein
VTAGTPYWWARGAASTLSRSVGGLGQDPHGAVVRRLSIGARVALFIVALVATVLLGGVAPAPTSAQVGTEDPGATTETTVADPSATTVTTAAGAVEPEANVPGASEDSGGSTDTRTSRRLLAIIGALLGIGLLIMVLTVLYWRHTKPSRRTAAEPEWVEGEGWVTPHETDEPDPVKMQRRLQRRRRRREDRAAAPVGEWFAEPDPTLDPFAPDAPSAVPVLPSGEPAAAATGPRAPGAGPRTGGGGPSRRPAAGNGQQRQRPRPAANGGAPPNGRPPRQAPPGTQPQRVAKKRAAARSAPEGRRPAADGRRAGQGPPGRTRPPQQPDGTRRRAPQGPPSGPGADPAGQSRRPRPAPKPAPAEDWDAQTDELAEFWQEMRNKDA